MNKSYVVTYENGATNFIQAESLVAAIQESVIALHSCMPKGFELNNLVRPVKAEQIKDFADFNRYKRNLLDPS